MGYATVMRVPKITDYQSAIRKLNNTKPIKGREPAIVPLGERRDCDTYSIRKNIWNENVELVLYQTPVIKFTPNDEVIIGFGRWSSASTCQFIDRVLGGVNCNRVRGDVVLHFVDGAKYVLGEYKELVLVRGANGQWQPAQKQQRFDLRVNRRGANNVRKRVSQFKNYLSGMMKLKEEVITQNAGTYYETTYTNVSFTYTELAEVLGVNELGLQAGRAMPNIAQFENICKPEKWQANMETPWEKYGEHSKLFYELVRDDQDDNVRHQNYWIALNALVCLSSGGMYFVDRDMFDERKVRVTPNKVMAKLEQFLFGFFSDEVFKEVELGDNEVSTGKYADYVRKGVEE